MKYVPLPRLREGMALGQDIYDGLGDILLKKHCVLDAKCMHDLEEWGFPGVYIDDEFSKQIEIDHIVKPELRNKTKKLLASVYEEKFGTDDEEEQRIQKAVEEVVDAILSNDDLMYNLMNIRAHDKAIYDHSMNVCMLSILLGVRMDLAKEQLKEVATAALLHDIGKKFINADILNTRQPLSEEQCKQLSKHSQLGYDHLKERYHFSEQVCLAVLDHHENYDGTGYPNGKSGNEISRYAQIIRVADTFDAMTAGRPYKKAQTPSAVTEYIMANDGVRFAPEIVLTFTRWVSVYPSGCEVLLSDGRSAVVVKNYPNFTLRPMIKIIESGETVDLKQDATARNITIVDMV
jgi:HD-GYP domain-containing protein (c-di-GMP phosphodiesterase class II)